MELLQVLDLMTPDEILKMEQHERARPIMPEMFKKFDDLLSFRGSIRNLALLPIKSDVDRATYNSIPKDQLERQLLAQLGEHEHAVLVNQFPYLLPPDVTQRLLWLRDRDAPRERVAEIILALCVVEHISVSELITFERPLRCSTSLVKGTFAQVRHVHLWTRKVYSILKLDKIIYLRESHETCIFSKHRSISDRHQARS